MNSYKPNLLVTFMFVASYTIFICVTWWSDSTNDQFRFQRPISSLISFNYSRRTFYIRPSSAGLDRNPFAGEVFSSWKDITDAVHREALNDNKQVSCTASLSGSKKKFTNVCTCWVASSGMSRKCEIGLAKSIPTITSCERNA
jgi:hypothetical protein